MNGNTNKKSALIGAAVIVVVIALVAVWFFGNRNTSNNQPEEKLVLKVNTLLSPEQVAATQSKVELLREQIAKRDTKGDTDLLVPYITLGQQYELLGELGLARDAYMGAASENPNAGLPWIDLGILYPRMGSNNLATSAFKRAISLEPTLVQAWEGIINFSRNNLNYGISETKALYAEALKATSNNARLYKAYADYLVSIGERANAVTLYENLVKAYPEDQNLKTLLNNLRSGKY